MVIIGAKRMDNIDYSTLKKSNSSIFKKPLETQAWSHKLLDCSLSWSQPNAGPFASFTYTYTIPVQLYFS